MGRRWQIGMLGMALLAAGCVNGNGTNRDPLSSLWGGQAAPPDAPPAPTETASRVDSVGRKILAANPDVKLRPLFTAIGTPKETVFHQGKDQLYISDGLVKRCKTDGELAAVLCLELGRMVSEEEARAAREQPLEDRSPLGPPARSDIAGIGGTPDQTEMAERVKFEQTRPRPRGLTPPPPDPHVLAKGYLTKAGFNADDLTKVGMLVRSADKNPQFERQLGGGGGLGIPTRERR